MKDLRNDTNKENINKNEEPNQVIDIIKRALNFDKQQGLKY